MRFQPVEVFLETTTFQVSPGGAVTVAFRAANRTSREDYFEITTRGIPTTWVMTDLPVIHLDPGEMREASLTIRPPAGMSGASGVASVVIQVTSQADPTRSGEAVFDLFVEEQAATAPNQTQPVSDQTRTVPSSAPAAQPRSGLFRTDLSPRQIGAGQTARLRIHNQETYPVQFTVQWQSPDDALEIVPSTSEPITILAGETVAVDFTATPRSPHWVGRSRLYPYTAIVRSSGGAVQSHAGEVIGQALIPVWVLPALLVLCLTAVCGVGFLWNWNQKRAGSLTATAVAAEVRALVESTATASYYQTAAALAGQEDTDGDGLTNTQEVELGTNPQSADSDNDRASDGDEVRLGLDPLNPDTDGDGILDGLDLDPRDATNPALTQTAQALATPSPSPETPTLTSTAPPTLTPTPTTAPPTRTPTPTQPITGPGLILFDSNRDGDQELYVFNLSDAGVTRLTNSPGEDIQPAWSPDGSQLAFTSARSGNNEIYVVNSDGSGLVNVTDNPADDSEPVWSPDGSSIAFTSDRDGNKEIYVIGADGSAPTNLTGNAASDSQPFWFPGGILFTSDRDGNAEIYAVEEDGSNPENLTNNGAQDSAPAMRPDGGRILFVSNRDGNTEIYAMESDGGNPQNLTEDPAGDGQPAYSPDGNWILFVTNRDGNLEIYAMTSSGAEVTNLTNNPGQDQNPAWR